MPMFSKVLSAVLVLGLLAGCEKQAPAPAKLPADAPTKTRASAPAGAAAKPTTQPKADAPDPHSPQMPPGHPPVTANPHEGGTKPPPPGTSMPALPPGMPDPHAATGGGTPAASQPTETQLEGITMQIPAGWVYEAPEPGQGMPGMAPKAIFRLNPVEGDSEPVFVRVTHFPGMNVSDEFNIDRWYSAFTQPDGRPTKDASKVESFDVGEVKIVFVDVSGTMTVNDQKGPGSKPGWRMLGAIIKDPKGPHFVKVVGPTKSVEHWKDSVLAYLKSVKTN
jgi:hypothetical protein